jgi:hypothetical protein
MGGVGGRAPQDRRARPRLSGPLSEALEYVTSRAWAITDILAIVESNGLVYTDGGVRAVVA